MPHPSPWSFDVARTWSCVQGRIEAQAELAMTLDTLAHFTHGGTDAYET